MKGFNVTYTKNGINICIFAPTEKEAKNLIQFYDSKDDNFRTAKVVSIQSVAGGTEVIVFDLDSKKERQFIMY